jgi:hypothetical protein
MKSVVFGVQAVLFAMDRLSLLEIPTNYERDSPRWENEWSPTERCWDVMRWVRGE